MTVHVYRPSRQPDDMAENRARLFWRGKVPLRDSRGIAGIACFPLALYAGSLESVFPRGPAALVLPIVILSALAGGIASLIVDPAKAPDIGGVPLRVGVRAGFIASLVGGGVTVAASTLHVFEIGTVSSVEFVWNAFGAFLPISPTARVIVLAVLAIPPSIFFGLTGAMLAGMLCNQCVPTTDGTQSQILPGSPRSPLFVTAIVLTILCYFSPLLAVFKPKPKPFAAAVVYPSLSTPAPAPSTPAPKPVPKWRYKTPDGFETADAGRLVIAEQRILGEVAQKLPVAISPDGNRIAYCRPAQTTQFQVVDLETLDVITSVQIGATPAAFAWSPDSKMVLIKTASEENPGLMVFDVGSSRLMPLPQPRDGRLPSGRPRWWDNREVVFSFKDAASVVLDLDILRVAPLDASPKWKAMSEAERDDFKRGTGSLLPRNSRWQMSVATVVNKYEVPLTPAGGWRVDESMRLAFVHPQKAYRFGLASADVSFGDFLFAAVDGSKLVRIRQNDAIVYFFGVRPEAATRFKVSMPGAPDASIGDALTKRQVAAFVCAPLINPLNGRTVGPDRDHVKAIARVASWQDKAAEFWIDEDYAAVQPGDVVADVHTWEERKPRVAGEAGKSEWFAVIDKISSDSPPPRTEAAMLDRELTLNVNGWLETDGLVEITTVSPRHLPKPATSAPPPVVVSPETPQTLLAPNAQKPSSLSETPTTIIRRFIIAHCAKIGRRDLQAWVNDFSEPVDYYGQGMVNRAAILRRTLTAQAQGRSVDKVVSDIVVTPHGMTTFEARLDVETKAYIGGREAGRVVWAQIYTIALAADGPSIVKLQSGGKK